MKKLLLTLSALALGITGASLAGAQYYNTSYYSTTHTPSTSYQYSHGAAVGSYTIGCTTYYYNMTSGAHLGSENICHYTTPATYPITYTPTVYNPPVRPPVVYQNPSYADYYSYPTNQYCTWGHHNGQWHECNGGGSVYGGGTMYGGGYGYNPGYQNEYQNYLNCYYDQHGQHICW